MKKFTFDLQPVLDRRAQVEREKGAALAAARRKVLEQEETLRVVQENIDSAREDVRRGERPGVIDVVGIREQRAHLARLRRLADDARRQLRSLEAEFASRREQVISARGDRKVLEMLKARRLARHQRRAARTEQAELDDIAHQREILKRTGS